MTTNERKHMKPFDLEAAKAGAPIVTGNGRPVRFIMQVADAHESCCVVILELDSRFIRTRRASGRVNESVGPDNPNDLFMAAQKKTLYVNFYDDGSAFYYDIEKDAQDERNFSINKVIARAVPVEIEI